MATKKEQRKAGFKVAKVMQLQKKKTDSFYEETTDKLNKLNKSLHRRTKKHYNSVFADLELGENNVIENNLDNLAKVSDLIAGLEIIQAWYRKSYGKFMRQQRRESTKLLKLNYNIIHEAALEAELKPKPANNKLTAKDLVMVKEIAKQGNKKINNLLVKWKNFAHDNFLDGITNHMQLKEFNDSFYTKTGKIKIGSDFENESFYETMQRITKERTETAYAKAKKDGYKQCWNSNPMDARTKGRCIRASMAGVISADQMRTEHSFPPRNICRCELMFTHEDWKEFNRGVNDALRDRRLVAIQLLEEYPKQMSEWIRDGKTVHAKDPDRAAGVKFYAEIKAALDEWQSGDVPEI